MYDSEPQQIIVKLEDWHCVDTREQSLQGSGGLGWWPSYYAAPFFSRSDKVDIRLAGRVINHPKHDDGKFIKLSPVISTNGRKVMTKNTLYIVGRPDQDYIEWAESKNIKIDPENPFYI